MNANRKALIVHLAIATAIVVFALFLRIYYQQVALIDHPVRADAAQYYQIAWNILHHGVVSMSPPGTEHPLPDSYRGPGYPLLLAGVLWFTDESPGWYSAALMVQAVLGAATVALIMLLASGFMARPYVWAVGLLAALWPHAITLSGYLLTETLFGVTLVLGLYLLWRALASNRMITFGLAGGVFSLSAMVNPVITLFPLLASALIVRRGPRQALVFLVCAALLPVLWSVRGMMIESSAGASSSSRLVENILAGAEPDFDGYYRGEPAGLQAREAVNAELALHQTDPDALRSMLWHKLATRPGYYLTWYLVQKPLKFWTWNIGQGVGDVYVYPTPISPFEINPWYRLIHAVCYGLNTPILVAALAMVVLVAVRTLRGDKVPDALMLVAMLFLYATAVHTLLTPDARYATPFRALEIALAVGFVAALFPRILARRAAAIVQAKAQ